MIYLIPALCSSALISILMRLGEGRIRNNISLLSVNYLICLLLSMAFSVGSGSFIVPLDTGRAAVVLGAISGVFYFGSFLLYQINIFRNGVTMSSAFMKLGVLMPVMLAVIFFGERPGIGQIAGICLAVAAILIISLPQPDPEDAKTDGEAAHLGPEGAKTDGEAAQRGPEDAKTAGETGQTVTAPRLLILLLLIGGSGDAMSKFYEELGRPEYNSQYLLYTFLVAFIFCTIAALMRGQRFTAPDILFGCLVGVPNYFSARFLLLSLSTVPAVIAYPVFSVGTIVLTGAAGVFFFHEKMTARQWAALAVIIGSLILLNRAG